VFEHNHPAPPYTFLYPKYRQIISQIQYSQAWWGGGEEARDHASGEVQEVRGVAGGLLLACTHLDGASGCQHHHFGHLQHLIRAGQLPQPCFGGVLAVLCRGLGWLLQLTQGRSLCIPASPKLALAHPGPGAARWQGLLTNSHPHDSNVLPAGSLDPCREGANTRLLGEALEAC